jgi:hypothetical protein
LKWQNAILVKPPQHIPYLLIQVSRPLPTHMFARKATPGMKAFDKIFDRLEERNGNRLSLSLLAQKATRL